MTTKPDKPQAGQAPEEIEISLYQASKKIYARSVKGLFNTWRWALVWITQIVFYGLPWLVWNNRQAVLFDLEARRFYLFGLVLYPQDFIYLTGLLVIAALALFLFTAVAGRLWCGYACPQTVYTEIFMWIEKVIEGDRSARMRLDDGELSRNKFGRKALKHAAWVLFALWTGVTFVGYFTPIKVLVDEILSLGLGPWETFWVLFYGFATYGNAGWMREQVCKYMCPYARFQSAMFDRDTMIVTYDEKRGEPRGPRKKSADPQALGLGSCIDCTLCVQVCPTGIDIRKGLQYECIGCGACVDACDDVMDKVGYPRGLIKYATENGMENGWNRQQMIKRAMRPRVLIYTGVLLAICIAVAVSLFMRTPLKVDVIRDRGAIARMVEQGRIENVFRLQAMNATEVVQKLEVSVDGLPGIMIASERQMDVQPTEVRSLVLRVQIPPGSSPSGSHHIKFQIRSLNDSGIAIQEETVFLVPR
ncbi:cytochrome c oxidase accessory protein CcoG [Malikia granosa]|uniref:Cytochrome c oxidase accessory protein CcoG n=1 Tax=Malikia granosa TaxID=263067 RepID=A0A2S9K810_9BURK|nr:cytochrome c oxidase accessory protein CcoG [Malikia granosa]PRD66554.1 cytochrome c oxidase accessory protein CcoG [Malikia granosa]